MKHFTLLLMGAVVCSTLTAQCVQPAFNFQGSSKVSGTTNAVGSVYKFTGVLTGVDAFVTILDAKNASVQTFDDDANGYKRAWQPEIKSTSTLLTPAWVKFRVDFKKTAGTAHVLPCLAMTIVDNDGTSLFQERISTTNVSSYNKNLLSMLGFSQDSFFNAKGALIDFSGIDTSAKEAMGQVNYTNVSSIILKVGAVGVLSSTTRQYSMYFQNFGSMNQKALPVTLINFTAVNTEDKKVELSWTTASEINNSHFDIERSINSGDFTKVGEIGGNGTSDKMMIYNFEDYVAPGQYTYRLKQVDYNGMETYSGTKYVRVGAYNLADMTLKPNPFETECRVGFYSDGGSKASVKVMNAMGQVLYSEQFETQEGYNEKNLNLPDLADGLYFIEARTDEQIFVKRIEKRK